MIQLPDTEMERVILVGVDTGDGQLAERSLDELAKLAKTAGAEVAGRLIQTRESLYREREAYGTQRPHLGD